MKPKIIFAVLLLSGACLTGIIIGSMAGGPAAPVPSLPSMERLSSESSRATAFIFSQVEQTTATMEHGPFLTAPAEMACESIAPLAADTAPKIIDESEINKIAGGDPAEAVKLAAKIDPAQRASSLMEDLVQRWANGDLLSAAAWVEMNTAGDERDRLLQRVGFTLAQASPAEAAEFVVSQISPGPVQDEAVMTVINQWGNKNLAEAATWVQTFPEGELQKRAVAELEGIERFKMDLAHQ